MVPRQRGLICTLSSWGVFGVPYGVGKAACNRMAGVEIELVGGVGFENETG